MNDMVRYTKSIRRDHNRMEGDTMLKTISIKSIQDILLPLTEFRKNLSNIIEELSSVKVLMKNDKPKAVLLPYDMYVKMEEELEAYHDLQLQKIANERLKEGKKFISSEEMRKLIVAEDDENEIYG